MKKFLVLLVMISILLCGTAHAAVTAVEDDFSFLAADGALAGTPESEVTNKELVTVVARLHSVLNGGDVSESDDYAKCTAYSVENGLFVSDAIADETASVTRADVVCALYKAVNGKISLDAINEVLDIADSDPNADYYEAAESFTKAGIIYGFDKYGSFKPTKSVKKYELTLMISRLLNPADRVTKQYIVYSSDEPFFLIDDFLHDYGARGWYTGGSGWRIDYTGSTEVGTINKYSYVLRDFTSEDNMSTSRRFHTQADGKLVFEAVYKIDTGNTFGMCFYDIDGNEVADAGWKNGVAYIGPQTSTIKLADVKQPDLSPDVNQFNHYMAGLVRTRMILDLDGGTYEVWMGKNYIGKQALAGSNVAKLKLYTGIEEVSTVTIKNTHLYKNYKVNDLFRLENQNDAPVGYDVQGNVTVERITANANNIGDVNSVKMVTTAGSTTYAKRSFDKASGIVVAEAYVLLDDGNAASTLSNKAYVTLKSEDTAVLTIKSNGTNWYSGRKKLYSFTSNVWQLIRIEANTNTQKATVKINGKVVGEIAFFAKVDGFDGIEFGVEATTADDVIWFDDIKVFETFEYDDYCPEPVPLDTGNYVLNMSVCNLWRNGSHYGWDWIRPFAELEPAIGYYDEGIPEAMDWEIKYLTEHGIKNYMTCWYPISGNVPLKKPRMIDALHDGYFNAKYSDKMTFSLMFENSGYISDKQLDDFKNYVFPMWMEWYFSDPRYCRIQENGKEYIFLTIYQYLYFLDMACKDYVLLEYNENGDLYLKKDYQPSGSTPSSVVLSACKDAAALIDWMEDQIIDAGYADGLIAVFGGSTQNDAAYKTMANMGGDGIILYAWGRTAWDVETQKNLATTHMANSKNNGIEMLTLATPGFNDIGWTTLRPGYMTTDNFETMLKWHKDRMGNSSLFSQDSWKSKFITFDTWNEYGEGHYFFPTKGEYKDLGYGGFGYLDVIAEVFGGVKRGSEAAEANNTYPTEEQQARLTRLYPNDMDHYLRRDVLEKVEIANQLKSLAGRDFTSNATANNTSLEASPSNFVNNSRWSFLKDHFQYDSSRKCWYGKTTSSCSTSYPARIDFDGDSQFKNIKMDDVSYIRLRYGTSLGGSTGKIYFKNTTDTSQYDGYTEERTFRFNTYKESDCENGKYYEYLINVKENKQWTGTLAGIMVEFSNKANDSIYIYDIEFLTEDDSTRKPQIYVDKQKYECKDYGEIRSFDRNELYITPTEEGGLYKLLHIVYSWNRNTNILTLDTPNGTTFKFTVGSNVAVVNGKDVTLDKKIELFDGAPVVPLIYILKTAGFNYAYDFTNRYLYVTVANKFELTNDITNGDAEGSDTTEFFSGASAYAVNVVTDPKDSTNKVWNVPSAASNVWTYIRTDFNWVAGKTYTIDFDARRTGYLGDGSKHPATSSKLVFNARYADTAGTNGVEHNPESTKVVITDEWQHFTITYTVADTLDTSSTFASQLSFYVDPYNSIGVPYQLDNIVVRTEPLAFKLLNGDAEDTSDNIVDQSEGFFSGHSGNPLTIETESNGNHYWKLTSNQVGNNSYSYIRQKTTFEKGVTYYYTVRAKVGTNAAGENVSNAKITLNARYYDASKVGQSGEWYAHSYDLCNAVNGSVQYFSTGNDWVKCKGSFTIAQGYLPNGGPNGNIVEEITFYMSPSNTSGVTFMFDDFMVTTDPDVYEGW